MFVSDTHTEHPAPDPLPKGDILLHAGDWTRFGDEKHVTIFNEWLGTLNFKDKMIVNGNHECNAPGEVVTSHRSTRFFWVRFERGKSLTYLKRPG